MKAIDSSNIHLFNPSYKPPEVFSRLKLEKRCLLKGVEAARRRVGGRGPLFKSTTPPSRHPGFVRVLGTCKSGGMAPHEVDSVEESIRRHS